MKLKVACGTWFYFLDLLKIYRTSRIYTKTLGMLNICLEVFKYQIFRVRFSSSPEASIDDIGKTMNFALKLQYQLTTLNHVFAPRFLFFGHRRLFVN